MRDVLRRMLGLKADRDGQAHALEALAAIPPDMPAPTVVSARERGHRRVGETAEAMLQDALAQKVLHAWSENRKQTMFPLTLNLALLSSSDRVLVIHTLLAAAAAVDSPPDGLLRARVAGAMQRLGGGADDPPLIKDTAARPLPLATLLTAVQRARLGGYAYAGALLVLGRPDAAGQSYLDYLAARLALPPAVSGSLARRYRG